MRSGLNALRHSGQLLGLTDRKQLCDGKLMLVLTALRASLQEGPLQTEDMAALYRMWRLGLGCPRIRIQADIALRRRVYKKNRLRRLTLRPMPLAVS